MGNWAIVVLLFVVSAVSGTGGWFAHAYWGGSVVSAGDAAGDAQLAVDDGSRAVAEVPTARTETEHAVERVRTVTRTVTVAGECPPGAGPVSADFDQQLRALAQARTAGGHSAPGRVPE